MFKTWSCYPPPPLVWQKTIWDHLEPLPGWKMLNVKKVKICRKCENLLKMLMFVKNVKICLKCENWLKM